MRVYNVNITLNVPTNSNS